jgi:hypothetical protein
MERSEEGKLLSLERFASEVVSMTTSLRAGLGDARNKCFDCSQVVREGISIARQPVSQNQVT